MEKGRALGSTGSCLVGCFVFCFFFPRIFTSPGTEFPHPVVNHGGSDLFLGNGFKKPPLPLAMKEINRFTGGEWDTLFRAFQKFLKLEGCYFLIGLRPGKGNMVSEQEGNGVGHWEGHGQLSNSLVYTWCSLAPRGFTKNKFNLIKPNNQRLGELLKAEDHSHFLKIKQKSESPLSLPFIWSVMRTRMGWIQLWECSPHTAQPLGLLLII